eukprot:4955622-Prorocentrum_lima.AAC.1
MTLSAGAPQPPCFLHKGNMDAIGTQGVREEGNPSMVGWVVRRQGGDVVGQKRETLGGRVASDLQQQGRHVLHDATE